MVLVKVLLFCSMAAKLDDNVFQIFDTNHKVADSHGASTHVNNRFLGDIGCNTCVEIGAPMYCTVSAVGIVVSDIVNPHMFCCVLFCTVT